MNVNDQPNGFVRVIDGNGTIMEGNFTKDGLRNGWSVCYNGHAKVITCGWYENDVRTGNYVEFNARDMSQKQHKCGWFVKGRKTKSIQNADRTYKVAYANSIFMPDDT